MPATLATASYIGATILFILSLLAVPARAEPRLVEKSDLKLVQQEIQRLESGITSAAATSRATPAATASTAGCGGRRDAGSPASRGTARPRR